MSEAHLNYFHGKRVLVTGGFGFIGTNLCRRLLALGAETTVMDRITPPDPTGWHSRMNVTAADIRDAQAVSAAVAGQDVIFNLAGTSGAADSNKTPHDDLDVNCRGHLTVLEACRALNPHVTLIFSSSRLVYGRPLRIPVDERHPLSPESIYAIHKLTAENYHLMYARTCGMKATVLRISNPFGPMQSGEFRSYGIANRFIQAAASGETITLFGHGEQRRDYLYIDDLVDVLLLSAWSDVSRNKIYNVGSGAGTRLFEMAELAVAAARNGKIESIAWPSDYQAVETGDYVSDITLAGTELGWRPTTAIHTGIERTLAFYRRSTQLNPKPRPVTSVRYRKCSQDSEVLRAHNTTVEGLNTPQ